MPQPLDEALVEEYPEFSHTVLFSWEQDLVFSYEDKLFREQGHYAGADFFEVFSFPLLEGEPHTVLADLNAIVISETLAEKYFGADWRGNTLGKVIRIDERADVEVTGVFAKVPTHSTLQFDYILPMEEFIQRNEWVEHWGNSGLQLFAKLKPGSDYVEVNKKIKDVIRKHHEYGNADVFLQPYKDMRLHSRYRNAELVGHDRLAGGF